MAECMGLLMGPPSSLKHSTRRTGGGGDTISIPRATTIKSGGEVSKLGTAETTTRGSGPCLGLAYQTKRISDEGQGMNRETRERRFVQEASETPVALHTLRA